MTDFVLATPNAKQVWSNDVTMEFVRESGFQPYMSTKGDGIFNVRNELQGSAGNIIHLPLIAKLRGTGVRGSTTLVGAEDVMANYSMAVQTDIVRNAVNVKLSDAFKTEMDLINAATSDLKSWHAEQLRTDLITAIRQVPVPGVGGTNPEDTYVAYESATTAQQNAWQLANADRVLYGSKKANLVSGNHASSLANVGSDNDKLSARMIQLMRKIARATTTTSKGNGANFAIRPYKTKSGQEWYVLFVDSNGFRDLQNDTTILQANQNARPRETDINDNPLFSGDYLTYSGVIIKEIPELPTIGAVGKVVSTVTTVVGYAALCGLQAVNLGFSKQIFPTRRKEDDYGMNAGVAATCIRGQAKASVLGTQVGMVSVFFASVDDA